MARTNIPVQVCPANGGGIQAVTKTAGDSANDHEFFNDGKCMLMVENLDASTKAVTVVSVPDQYGRLGDVAMTVPAVSGGVPGVAFAGPFPPALFNQRGAADLGKVFVDLAASTNLRLWVISAQGFQG